MALMKELVAAINNDSINNENLIVCLESDNLRVVGMAIFKIIERDYCNKAIINRLIQLSQLLKESKFIGPWQFGHIAIATLLILHNEDSKKIGNQIFVSLSETDKFLVENFIKSEAYKS